MVKQMYFLARAKHQVVPWLMVLFLLGCGKTNPNRYQGYIEAEWIRVAAPLSGSLQHLRVQRGDLVKTGQALFELECQVELAAQKEAVERLQEAKFLWENAKKGRRPTEIAAIEAQLAQAQTALQLSQSEFKRWETLREDNVISANEFDRVRTAYERDQRRVEEIKAELATAHLGARSDEIHAAEAEVALARAALERADWNVAQKQQASPTNALVQDTLYVEGEWVAAGSPIVMLLPPAYLKVRFFVPQAQVSSLQINQPVRIQVDGLAQGLAARVKYISPQVEYTPPVIFSQENRAKLVFMVEATFEQADVTRLHPGQPVEVSLNP
jgi:HlyD family secretion protein